MPTDKSLKEQYIAQRRDTVEAYQRDIKEQLQQAVENTRKTVQEQEKQCSPQLKRREPRDTGFSFPVDNTYFKWEAVPVQSRGPSLPFFNSTEKTKAPVFNEGFDPEQEAMDAAYRLQDWLQEELSLRPTVSEVPHPRTGICYTVRIRDEFPPIALDEEIKGSAAFHAPPRRYESLPPHYDSDYPEPGTDFDTALDYAEVNTEFSTSLPESEAKTMQRGVAAAQLSFAARFNPELFTDVLAEEPIEKVAAPLRFVYEYDPAVEELVAEYAPALYEQTRREHLFQEHETEYGHPDMMYSLVNCFEHSHHTTEVGVANAWTGRGIHE